MKSTSCALYTGFFLAPKKHKEKRPKGRFSFVPTDAGSFILLSMVIVDSSFLSLAEATAGIVIPDDIRQSLALVTVEYLSFDGCVHKGQLVVHQDLATEVQEIFVSLKDMRFPIARVVPVVVYDWDDERSMQDNNSSAFNYRTIIGTDRLSNHSLGRALDLNPLQNPYFARDSNIYPAGAVYDSGVPGTITKGDDVVTLFTSYGWVWLGERSEYSDFQHFEKCAPEESQ